MKQRIMKVAAISTILKFTVFSMIIFEISEKAVSETFTSKLLLEVAKANRQENFVISPASIRSSLGLIYMGTEGRAAEELQNVLQIKGHDKDEVGKEFKAYLNKFEEIQIQLKTASRLYFSKGYTISEEYEHRTKKYFNAPSEVVDFEDTKTAKKINAWVEAQTMHHIKNIVNPSSLHNQIVVLINAIYFKANWRVHFKTVKEEFNFHVTEKKTVPVDLIISSDIFNYTRLPDLKASALEIPYNKTDLRMLLLLPDSINGLAYMEKKIFDLDFTKIIFKPVDTVVALPKFKIDFGTSLLTYLKNVGLKHTFNSEDLTGFVKNKKKFEISEIYHKGYIEVSEKGTRAAAATVTSSRSTQNQFTVDHPFFFAVRDDETIYFAGHITHF